jgi:hypothetical protein
MMKAEVLAIDGKHTCDNCGATFECDQLEAIESFFERVEPGGLVPSGECPDCGALCYPAEVFDGQEDQEVFEVEKL